MNSLRSPPSGSECSRVRRSRAFFDHGCRWRATAAALHIHHNTLRYRLKRVEELTGRDLSLVADRLDMQIALLVPD